MSDEQKTRDVLKLFGIPQNQIDDIMAIEMPESKNFPKEIQNEIEDDLFNGELGF